MPIVKHLPYNWSTDRQGHGIVAIIAHNTVGTDSRAYLSRGGDLPNGSDRRVSIHVLIQKDGTIYRYVPDALGANHAGFGKMPPPWAGINPNLCTLSFELENASDGIRKTDPYPDIQLLSMGWQINQWRAAYGPLPIFRHAYIDPSRRKDTVGLSNEQIEQWANGAALAAPPAAPKLRRFKVKGTPVYQARACTGTVAALLDPGNTFEVDTVYADGIGHLASGIGFIRLDHDVLEELP